MFTSTVQLCLHNCTAVLCCGCLSTRAKRMALKWPMCADVPLNHIKLNSCKEEQERRPIQLSHFHVTVWSYPLVICITAKRWFSILFGWRVQVICSWQNVALFHQFLIPCHKYLTFRIFSFGELWNKRFHSLNSSAFKLSYNKTCLRRTLWPADICHVRTFFQCSNCFQCIFTCITWLNFRLEFPGPDLGVRPDAITQWHPISLTPLH